MASTPITTGPFTDGDVSTPHKSGQSTEDWIEDHNDAIKNKVPQTDKLKTTWESDNGMQDVSTTRLSGESDAQFLSRHVNEYNAAMATEPPIS